MVLSTHGSGRARGEREEQWACACGLEAGGRAAFAKMPLLCWDGVKASERVGQTLVLCPSGSSFTGMEY